MKKIYIFLLAVFLNAFVLVGTVFADMGPKPMLDIIGTNMPNDICYMDLLIDESLEYANFTVDKENYDENMINLLLHYKDDGWRPAMATGTSVPLFGDILCEVKDGECHMNYSYLGVPDHFKIIVVTKSNEVVVSNVVHRKAFQSKVYFDFKKGTASESAIVPLYLKQFMATFSATIIIEGIILLIFGFSLKKNFKPFIIINLLTQLLLTLVVISNMISNGTLTALIAYFPFEIVILLMEGILFSRYLLEHKKWRRITYAVVANIVSFVCGVIIMLRV